GVASGVNSLDKGAETGRTTRMTAPAGGRGGRRDPTLLRNRPGPTFLPYPRRVGSTMPESIDPEKWDLIMAAAQPPALIGGPYKPPRIKVGKPLKDWPRARHRPAGSGHGSPSRRSRPAEPA